MTDPIERTIQERMRAEADYVELEWGECATSEVMRESASALDAAEETIREKGRSEEAHASMALDLETRLDAAEARLETQEKVLRDLVDWKGWPEVNGAFDLAAAHGYTVAANVIAEAQRRWDAARDALGHSGVVQPL